MSLLDHYLRAVRLYLPKRAPQDDILLELSEHLRARLEDREAELGRPLTELEQETLLAGHGSPATVAERYGATNHGLAFGRQIIGPEVFPLYVRILLLHVVLTVGVQSALAVFAARPVTAAGLLVPLGLQFVVVTVIFAAIDALKRRPWPGDRRDRPSQHWGFPPLYLQQIPRWQSVSGGVVLSLFALWWAALPYVPALLFARAADDVVLADGWHRFYWPVLVLLLAGVAQRVVVFLHPDRISIQAVSRLVVNACALALTWPFLASDPYVSAAATAPDPVAAVRIASRFSAAIWWNVFCGLALYWLINVGFHGWLCIQIGRHALRRRHEPRSPAGPAPLLRVVGHDDPTANAVAGPTFRSGASRRSTAGLIFRSDADRSTVGPTFRSGADRRPS